MKLRSFFAVLMLMAFAVSPAQARKHHQVYQAAEGCNVLWPCEGVTASPRGEAIVKAMGGFGAARKHYRVSSGAVIGGRPSGCPYQFCGCSASLYLFGKIIPSLNLAANWFKFPRTMPAPKMVAVRQHHVMVLVAQSEGGWLVHDGNSGGHLTRLHIRSLNGYTIVNPSGAV